MTTKPKFTEGEWKAWQLAPDSDPQERSIVVSGPDGNVEVCGIVNNPADVPLITVAKEMYHLLAGILAVWDQDDSYPIVREKLRAVLLKARGE